MIDPSFKHFIGGLVLGLSLIIFFVLLIFFGY